MFNKVLTLLLLFTALPVFGQRDTVVFFHLDKTVFKQNITAKKSIKMAEQNAIGYFKLYGHVGISITDSTLKKNAWHYYCASEKQYKKVVVKTDGETYTTELYDTPKAINSLLVELENTGFPFAKINISAQIEIDDQLEISCEIDSGQYMTIGKIIINSPDKFHQNTIENIIFISSGDPYNEAKVNAIASILAQENYYELIRAPELLFRENTVDLYLTLKKKNASIADGFIGFQQNPETFRLQLNGNVNLGLKNGLNRGEILDFKWRSNPDKSQNLDLEFAYPFIANLPIGLTGNMTIQKQDTSFIRNMLLGGIDYLASNFKIGIFAQSENSYLLGNNDIPNANFIDYRRTTVGFNGTFQPTISKKYRPKIKFKIGAFSINSDSIQNVTNASNLIGEFALIQNINLYKAFYYSNTLRFQDIRSQQSLTKNQLFYFGGLKSIRGFYELELNGNHVFSANNAIIFKPVKQLSFELLYDYAQFHSNQFTQTHSVGVGFNIENENNTLSIVLANGTIVGNGFNFQNSKLHLGFISHF
jgi:outer membrane protein assembly factor BamA